MLTAGRAVRRRCVQPRARTEASRRRECSSAAAFWRRSSAISAISAACAAPCAASSSASRAASTTVPRAACAARAPRSAPACRTSVTSVASSAASLTQAAACWQAKGSLLTRSLPEAAGRPRPGARGQVERGAHGPLGGGARGVALHGRGLQLGLQARCLRGHRFRARAVGLARRLQLRHLRAGARRPALTVALARPRDGEIRDPGGGSLTSPSPGKRRKGAQMDLFPCLAHKTALQPAPGKLGKLPSGPAARRDRAAATTRLGRSCGIRIGACGTRRPAAGTRGVRLGRRMQRGRAGASHPGRCMQQQPSRQTSALCPQRKAPQQRPPPPS
jgi:hypothetical protein